MGGGEACTSRPVTNEQARRLVLNLSRFLTCCVADQIRLTSENCKKALKLLHNVVTTPMPSINTIAVEVFKKYILVSLIQNRLCGVRGNQALFFLLSPPFRSRW
ncbi:hypothetical protein OIU77_002456 [Salix suchowensis]|uniref:COP9 signalosome complex subunit 3 N-terminal helical repeats domain-containing protein n=1 Tax=Salix suchowensis TaxID=1278906 RepID=A0ABQ9AWL9_9ROSI|nr:hypothetical protein OIU77_002456 [Salix suchowensis]